MALYSKNIDIANDVADRLEKWKLAFMDEFKTRVAQRTPVRTGALQAGWETVPTDVGFQLTNDMDYAIYVEAGTPHMAPRGMVATTILEIPEIVEVAKTKAGL